MTKMYKRVLALLMALVLMFSCTAFASAATPESTSSGLTYETVSEEVCSDLASLNGARITYLEHIEKSNSSSSFHVSSSVSVPSNGRGDVILGCTGKMQLIIAVNNIEVINYTFSGSNHFSLGDLSKGNTISYTLNAKEPVPYFDFYITLS